jgi:hypothetical protein
MVKNCKKSSKVNQKAWGTPVLVDIPRETPILLHSFIHDQLFFFFIDDCQLFKGSLSLFAEKRGP